MPLTTVQEATLELSLEAVMRRAASVYLQGDIAQTRELLVTALQPYTSADLDLNQLSNVSMQRFLRTLASSSLRSKVDQVMHNIVSLGHLLRTESNGIDKFIRDLIGSTTSSADDQYAEHEWLLPEEKTTLCQMIRDVYRRCCQNNPNVLPDDFEAKDFHGRFITAHNRIALYTGGFLMLEEEMTDEERASLESIKQNFKDRMKVPVSPRRLSDEQVTALLASMNEHMDEDIDAANRKDLGTHRRFMAPFLARHSELSVEDIHCIEQALQDAHGRSESQRLAFQRIHERLAPFIPQAPADLPLELQEAFFNWHRNRLLVVAPRLCSAIMDTHLLLVSNRSSEVEEASRRAQEDRLRREEEARQEEEQRQEEEFRLRIEEIISSARAAERLRIEQARAESAARLEREQVIADAERRAAAEAALRFDRMTVWISAMHDLAEKLAQLAASRVDISDTGVYSMAFENNESGRLIALLINPLLQHMTDYSNDMDLDSFRRNCEHTFASPAYANLNTHYSFFEKLYNAVVSVFRAFFDLFGDMQAPLAQRLTGRNYFFEYPTHSALGLRAQVCRDEFMDGLNHLITP
ncbi:MAG: hypothetical protein ACOYKA_04845 [Legionellaceae bacterium]